MVNWRSGLRGAVRSGKQRSMGGQRLHGLEAAIPGDLSSAAFFLCAAALFPESQLTISGLGLNPTRSSLLDLLGGMGVRISITQLEEQSRGIDGDGAGRRAGELKGGVIQSPYTEKLIDEIPVLAAIAPYTRSGLKSGMHASCG